MDSVRSRSYALRVYEELREAIITCSLPPGSIIFEQALAERYQVSKTPVREALQRLVQEGLVEAIHGVGYRILTMTVTDAHEIFEMRLILEKASADRAAQQITQEQLADLSTLAEAAYAYGDYTTYTHFLEANRAFHLAVAQVSGNSRLVSALRASLIEMERLLHLGLDLRDSAEEMREEHLALVQALSSGDARQAVQVMADQIIASRDRVFVAISNPRKALKIDL
ncbi:MAG TPA: GntR family transcriptional regulator [Anaerolineales bacterium]|nr:GntR family transcriptional regulator [Anaerolineales bacterium]